MADEEQKNENESGKKKGLSLPVLIAIIAGSVILLFVAIIFVISIMMNNMKDTIISSTGGEVEKVEDKKEDAVESLDKFDYMETGRITTNPAASSQFVVVNLGIFYAPEKSDKKDDEAAKVDPAAKSQRLNALIKHQVNSQIGDMDMYSLQIPRDSLMTIFKEKLMPSFKMEGYKLRDVILVEFIVQ
ncbi:MAG: hypothetical protein KIT33_09835 [Candidatus Kapabacteria bacterium]|nr:hypothetical protein [Ignavibacteriota bacterium]MCW5885257.1 hypothetical protein [Candidatus Kapabacteria bacterium]